MSGQPVKIDPYRTGNAFSLPEEPELSGLRFIVSSLIIKLCPGSQGNSIWIICLSNFNEEKNCGQVTEFTRQELQHAEFSSQKLLKKSSSPAPTAFKRGFQELTASPVHAVMWFGGFKFGSFSECFWGKCLVLILQNYAVVKSTLLCSA